MSSPPGFDSATLAQTRRFLSEPTEMMEEGRRRFGETFSIKVLRAGRLVFLSDPASIKALFAADRENIVAPGRNAVLEPLLGASSLLLINGSEHLTRRKLMLPPFHGERMRAYEQQMEDATERQLASWVIGQPFTLHASMQAITLEVIMAAVFGVSGEHREDLRALLTGILGATRSPLMIGVAARTPGLRHLPRIRRVERAIAETNAILAEEIAARRADPDLAEREDILSMLVMAEDDAGQGMTDAEIRDQLMTLLIAGHETTATALAWAFDLLFRNPEAMERLRAEVATEETAYLDAVIEETLRVRPVVMFTGRQLKKPMTLGGFELEAGTVVGPSIYLAHTRPDLYPEPYRFRPERFLEDPPETFAWVPFGGGTRRCIGAAFAEFEMRVVLRTILRQVELAPATDEPEEMVRRNVTLSPKQGTPAMLRRRISPAHPPVTFSTN
jgi:cytochrome P450 family 135